MTKATTQNQERKKVVIIGAGFSGLSVAYHLLQHQEEQQKDLFDVKILEARQRIGGRVHPYNLDGTVIDLGGQWIHECSRKNPIRKLLLEELQIPLHQYNQETEQTIVFNQDGKRINGRTVRSASKFYHKTLGHYDEQKVDENTSMQDLLDRALKAAPKTKTTNKFLQVINYLRHRTECNAGGRLCELSVDLDELYRDLGGDDEIPQGGYQTVIQALVSKIGSDKIELGRVVKSIEYETKSPHGKVTVTLEDGEWTKGDFCVCTIPLGVLQQRKIRFSPPLPAPKVKAIDSMGMGSLGKVALKFDRCFWNEDKFTITNADPTKIKYFYDCSDEVGAPVLQLFLGGDAARRVDSPSGLSDDEAVWEAMEALRLVFGKDVPDPVATSVSRWNLDPFAFGAYSFTKVGCEEETYDEVGRPVGNLLFAGEHSSKRNHSTVHGAWATGHREASRLVGWLKATQT